MSEESIRKQAERYIQESGEYSNPFEREKLIADWISKESAAVGLVSDFRRRAGEVAHKRILELGFGSGLHIPAFVDAGALMYGLEVSPVLFKIADENLKSRGVSADLKLYDGARMPYDDGFFDFIFCTSVIEHVSDVQQVLSEVNRVLKKGGKAYISFPNRLAPRETHSGFFFVQYLPRSLAARVMRGLGSNAVEDLNLNFLSYFRFKKALRDTSLRILPETEAPTVLRRFIKRFLEVLGFHYSILLKTVMVILVKD